MSDNKPAILEDKQVQPSRGTARQGVMTNTKAGTSGGPKPTVKPLGSNAGSSKR